MLFKYMRSSLLLFFIILGKTLLAQNSISGETLICPGVQYHYTATSSGTWTVTGGSIVSQLSTTEVIVVWTSFGGNISTEAYIDQIVCGDEYQCFADTGECYWVNVCTTSPTWVTLSLDTTPFYSTITASNSSVCSGVSVQFTATHNGRLEDSYGYQWKRNGVAIAGANGSIYTTTLDGSYTALVTRSDCSVESNSKTLTLLPLPAKPTAVMTSQTTLMGNAILTATNGTNYSWQRNGVTIAGANTNTYLATSTGWYTSVNTGGGCTNASTPVLIEIANTAIVTNSIYQQGVTTEAQAAALTVPSGSIATSYQFNDNLGRSNLSLAQGASLSA